MLANFSIKNGDDENGCDMDMNFVFELTYIRLVDQHAHTIEKPINHLRLSPPVHGGSPSGARSSEGGKRAAGGGGERARSIGLWTTAGEVHRCAHNSIIGESTGQSSNP